MMCPQCNQEKSDDMMCDCGKCKACCGGACKMKSEEGGGDDVSSETNSTMEGDSGNEGDAPIA